jgi:hypothetical protein
VPHNSLLFLLRRAGFSRARGNTKSLRQPPRLRGQTAAKHERLGSQRDAQLFLGKMTALPILPLAGNIASSG